MKKESMAQKVPEQKYQFNCMFDLQKEIQVLYAKTHCLEAYNSTCCFVMLILT